MVRRSRIRKGKVSKTWLFGAFIVLFAIYLASLPSGAEYKSTPPRTTSFIELYRSTSQGEGKSVDLKFNFVPIAQISPNLQSAVIASEDFNFVGHGGFDFSEVLSAVKQAWRERRFPRGASTITQQLARNLYLSPSRNPFRKIAEAVITLKLEHNLTKRRILELYLNCIEWGEGVYGAEAAARYYFGKSASELSAKDAAFLAAIIPNPVETFNPKLHPERVARRRNLILERMERVRLP